MDRRNPKQMSSAWRPRIKQKANFFFGRLLVWPGGGASGRLDHGLETLWGVWPAAELIVATRQNLQLCDDGFKFDNCDNFEAAIQLAAGAASPEAIW